MNLSQVIDECVDRNAGLPEDALKGSRSDGAVVRNCHVDRAFD